MPDGLHEGQEPSPAHNAPRSNCNRDRANYLSSQSGSSAGRGNCGAQTCDQIFADSGGCRRGGGADWHGGIQAIWPPQWSLPMMQSDGIRAAVGISSCDGGAKPMAFCCCSALCPHLPDAEEDVMLEDAAWPARSAHMH